jgi:hypothetical protein
MTEKPSAPERVQTAFAFLRIAAQELNSVSDELGKSIGELDVALQKLNLGVSAWVPFTESSDEDGWFCHRDIGYAKTGTTWGISLREVEGDSNYPDRETTESWLFENSPRWMRIEAIGKIPDLLERLTKQAEDTAIKIKAKTAQAKELTSAIKTIAAAK